MKGSWSEDNRKRVLTFEPGELGILLFALGVASNSTKDRDVIKMNHDLRVLVEKDWPDPPQRTRILK